MLSIHNYFTAHELFVLNLTMSSFCFIMASLILISILISPSNKESKNRRRFLYAILSLLATLGTDLFLRITYEQGNIHEIFVLVAHLSYIFDGLFAFFSFLYTLSVIEIYGKVNIVLKRLTQAIFFAASFIYLIPGVISIGINNTLEYGDLYTIRIGINVIMGVLLFLLLASSKKYIGKLNMLVYFAYFVLPLLAGMQTFWLDIPALLTYVIMVYLMYFSIYHRMSKDALEKERVLAQQHEQLTNAKIRMMESQIRPHFLFNTLNSIASLCYIDSHMAKETTRNFSKYLESNMDTANMEDLVPFEKEMEHVMLYTNIEKLRFGENLKVTYRLEATDFMIPPLTVQPLVENAIKHGVRSREGLGSIYISSEERESYYVIRVQDDGVGFDKKKTLGEEKSHLGLDLTKQRIELLCHGKVRISSTPGLGTLVSIRIPKEAL